MVWSLDTDDFNDKCYDGAFPLLTNIHTELQKPLEQGIDTNSTSQNRPTTSAVEITKLSLEKQKVQKSTVVTPPPNKLTTLNVTGAKPRDGRPKETRRKQQIVQRHKNPSEGNGRRQGPRRRKPQGKRPPPRQKLASTNVGDGKTESREKASAQHETKKKPVQQIAEGTLQTKVRKTPSAKFSSSVKTKNEADKGSSSSNTPQRSASDGSISNSNRSDNKTSVAKNSVTRSLSPKQGKNKTNAAKPRGSQQSPKGGRKRNRRPKLSPEQLKRRRQFLRMRRMKMRQKKLKEQASVVEKVTSKPGVN